MAFNWFRKDKKAHLMLLAPISGKCFPLEDVPDKVFSQKILGDGVAIQPVPGEGQILSPVDGKIILVAETGHAVGIQAANGREFLIHYGLDTVELNGRGFTALVESGAQVSAGDPLLSVDLAVMAEAGINPITMFLIVNDGPEIPTFHYGALVKKGEGPVISMEAK